MPLLPVSKSCSSRLKIVQLKSYEDARIVSILNLNVKKLVGKSHRSMTIAGAGGYQFYNEYGSRIEAGLVLDASMEGLWCSIADFEMSNRSVLKTLQGGWAQADIRDYPAIAYKEDPNQYALYIKDQNLLEEDTLIRFIAKKFKMESYIHCYQAWMEGAELGFSGKIYLWINKERLSNFIRITDFKLS